MAGIFVQFTTSLDISYYVIGMYFCVQSHVLLQKTSARYLSAYFFGGTGVCQCVFRSVCNISFYAVMNFND